MMMTMKPDRILEHQCLERLRREVRRNVWHGRILNALALLVCAVVLWWVMPPAWREAVMQWLIDVQGAWGVALDAGAVRSAPCALRAGFGVPEWVAYGIVMTVVLGLLGRLAWGAIVEGEEADTLAMPPEHDPLACGEEVDAPWMRSLKAFFAGRGVKLTNEQCVMIRAKCVPPGATSLPFLSVYLQRELKLRLLMTSLMEIQAICMGPLQPGRVG